MFNIWCLVVINNNEPVGNRLKVSVEDTEDVSDLREKVKAKAPHALVNIDAHILEVWRCTKAGFIFDDKTSPAQLQELFSKNQVQRIDSCQVVAGLHLTAQDIQLPPAGKKRKRDEDDEDAEADDAEYTRLSQICPGAPSSEARPVIFRKHVMKNEIQCNRPFDEDTIPIDILYEGFGQFQDRCASPPSKRGHDFLAELAHVACRWYDMEFRRRDAVADLLDKRLGLKFHAEAIRRTSFTTDRNLAVDIMPAAVRECKNESGHALNQAITYYAQFLKNVEKRYFLCNTCFPCILMVDQGTLLGFYGAVWNGHAIRAEPLTPMFDLSTHSSYERVRDQIASSLDAFVECVGTIGEHYRNLDAEGNAKTSHQQASQARRFPYLTSYEIDTRKIHVTFTERLYDSKRLFRVIDDSQASCEYVVKFSKRYSEDAHRFLASKGFAPKLLQCKLIPGGWFAVLMERSAYTLFNDFCGYRELVKQKLTEAIQLLHGNELVHGDIRSINLLVDEGSLSTGDVKIHLLDFDWAGRVGEAKYPLGVNTVSVQRPDDVEGGGFITKEHDVAMIKAL